MSYASEQLYFRDLVRYNVLTLEQEKDLVRRVKDGDSTATNPLVLGNLRFVVSIARRYQNKGLSLLELINEGNLGLFKAAKRFDPSREVKFISYAVWWIRQSIQKALFEQVGTVRIPPNKLSLVNRFKKNLVLNGGNYERTMEIPEFRDNEREIAEVMEKISEVSLNSPIGGASEGRDAVTTLLDVLGSEGSQETEAERAELSGALDSVLSQMSDREEKVLRMYYGINFAREFTLDEIGLELKLTRERVRQIKNKSLRKLLRLKDTKERLLPFMSGS